MQLNIYYNDYNEIIDEEEENIVELYNPNNLFIKGQRLLIRRKKMKKKSRSQPEEPVAERVKLRTQKADDKDLFDTSSPFTDDSDEFIDIPDMQPLEDDERVKEGKWIKNLNSKQIVN